MNSDRNLRRLYTCQIKPEITLSPKRNTRPCSNFTYYTNSPNPCQRQFAEKYNHFTPSPCDLKTVKKLQKPCFCLKNRGDNKKAPKVTIKVEIKRPRTAKIAQILMETFPPISRVALSLNSPFLRTNCRILQAANRLHTERPQKKFRQK